MLNIVAFEWALTYQISWCTRVCVSGARISWRIHSRCWGRGESRGGGARPGTRGHTARPATCTARTPGRPCQPPPAPWRSWGAQPIMIITPDHLAPGPGLPLLPEHDPVHLAADRNVDHASELVFGQLRDAGVQRPIDLRHVLAQTWIVCKKDQIKWNFSSKHGQTIGRACLSPRAPSSLGTLAIVSWG